MKWWPLGILLLGALAVGGITWRPGSEASELSPTAGIRDEVTRDRLAHEHFVCAILKAIDRRRVEEPWLKLCPY